MPDRFNVGIVGGGLAGLTAATLLARMGYKVLVLEKEHYPRNKVCGEYVSLESEPFLRSIGFRHEDYDLPLIHQLHLTDVSGRQVNAPLKLGGLGISRYLLDQSLAQIARQAGVEIVEGEEIENVEVTPEGFKISAKTNRVYHCQLAAGTWGKRSSIDIGWKRPFLQGTRGGLNNFVGIKYHLRYSQEKDVIALHNFRNGYAGLSSIENGLHCFCYMVNAVELRKAGSVSALEQQTLSRNPHLRKVLEEAERMPGFPLTISGISFEAKESAMRGLLLAGDAAGMITPLCGNGMSMAIHSGKLSAACIADCLAGRINREGMIRQYQSAWHKTFAARLKRGRFIQNMFGSERASGLLVGGLKLFPFLKEPLVKMTHGQPF